VGVWQRLLLVLTLAVASSCAGANLKTRASAVDEVIQSARKNGAQTCAPVQLAMAESHHAFALTEHSEGDYHRAKQELAIAEVNANEALRMSPVGRCVKVKKVPKPTNKDKDGDGILNADDECPDEPEDIDNFEDEDGCPDDDNDKDGFKDVVDECPDEAEDKDGFEDDDGCPDTDNDGDKILDEDDKCPDDPEDIDGFQDEDGCPDCDNDGDGVLECPVATDKCPDKAAKTADGCPVYKNVVITKKKIEIKQTVYFATNKTRIKPVSYGLLNEVAQALKDNPAIEIRVEGHTDSRGSDKRNLKLSDGRAASVMDYLKGQGVSESRMVSKGYGEDVPIADNRTRVGREQNRRVEFMITAQ
jgi:OOP family OmpA-OmpF porin